MVICLERRADLHMAQLMPLLLIVSCFSKIQIGFAFLVPAHPGSPGKKAVKQVCVCVCVCVCETILRVSWYRKKTFTHLHPRQRRSKIHTNNKVHRVGAHPLYSDSAARVVRPSQTSIQQSRFKLAMLSTCLAAPFNESSTSTAFSAATPLSSAVDLPPCNTQTVARDFQRRETR